MKHCRPSLLTSAITGLQGICDSHKTVNHTFRRIPVVTKASYEEREPFTAPFMPLEESLEGKPLFLRVFATAATVTMHSKNAGFYKYNG